MSRPQEEACPTVACSAGWGVALQISTPALEVKECLSSIQMGSTIDLPQYNVLFNDKEQIGPVLLFPSPSSTRLTSFSCVELCVWSDRALVRSGDGVDFGDEVAPR